MLTPDLLQLEADLHAAAEWLRSPEGLRETGWVLSPAEHWLDVARQALGRVREGMEMRERVTREAVRVERVA